MTEPSAHLGVVSAERRIYDATRILTEYLYSHAGTAYGPEESRFFSDDFRRFVAGMTAPGKPCHGMSLKEIYLVTTVPEEMLREWLR